MNAATVSTVVHSSFSIERRYPHPAARVFHALSNHDSRRRWFIEGEGWEVFEHRSDFRIGGYESSRFSFKGSPEITNDTQYHDIVPNRRMVFSYRMTFDGKPLSASLTTIELFETAGGTLLTYTEQDAFFDGMESLGSRQEGCEELMGKLGEFLDGKL